MATWPESQQRPPSFTTSPGPASPPSRGRAYVEYIDPADAAILSDPSFTPHPDSFAALRFSARYSLHPDGRRRLQPVELCFHDDWDAHPERPVSLHFGNGDAVTRHECPPPNLPAPVPPGAIVEAGIVDVGDAVLSSIEEEDIHDAGDGWDASVAGDNGRMSLSPSPSPGSRFSPSPSPHHRLDRFEQVRSHISWRTLAVALGVAIAAAAACLGRQPAPVCAVEVEIVDNIAVLDLPSRLVNLQSRFGSIGKSIATAAPYLNPDQVGEFASAMTALRLALAGYYRALAQHTETDLASGAQTIVFDYNHLARESDLFSASISQASELWVPVDASLRGQWARMQAVDTWSNAHHLDLLSPWVWWGPLIDGEPIDGAYLLSNTNFTAGEELLRILPLRTSSAPPPSIIRQILAMYRASATTGMRASVKHPAMTPCEFCAAADDTLHPACQDTATSSPLANYAAQLRRRLPPLALYADMDPHDLPPLFGSDADAGMLPDRFPGEPDLFALGRHLASAAASAEEIVGIAAGVVGGVDADGKGHERVCAKWRDSLSSTDGHASHWGFGQEFKAVVEYDFVAYTGESSVVSRVGQWLTPWWSTPDNLLRRRRALFNRFSSTELAFDDNNPPDTPYLRIAAHVLSTQTNLSDPAITAITAKITSLYSSSRLAAARAAVALALCGNPSLPPPAAEQEMEISLLPATSGASTLLSGPIHAQIDALEQAFAVFRDVCAGAAELVGQLDGLGRGEGWVRVVVGVDGNLEQIGEAGGRRLTATVSRTFLVLAHPTDQAAVFAEEGERLVGEGGEVDGLYAGAVGRRRGEGEGVVGEWWEGLGEGEEEAGELRLLDGRVVRVRPVVEREVLERMGGLLETVRCVGETAEEEEDGGDD
ncbi:hypothetical protein QBC33DRAFT_602099 [Phialemonium atrogriseum]|uniref:Uncharacterized protein n=1 Tax=Phialemonium atrogriseum TaxID=1093897 RepID=A0AAJ0FCI3_9PEZI|nr:uncharacterized protein QBC33DRAFT_602099 [Phialemonium atrogriseum]KAK1762147.1 hypothetical protein QBC33DRAFT_602099 [Phialemonium atrogriseum]